MLVSKKINYGKNCMKFFTYGLGFDHMFRARGTLPLLNVFAVFGIYKIPDGANSGRIAFIGRYLFLTATRDKQKAQTSS